MNDSRSGTVGAPSTSGISFRLTPPPDAVSFSSWAAVRPQVSADPPARLPVTATPSLSVPRRESPAGTRVRIGSLLTDLWQHELEDRQHDVLPGCWRAGTRRGRRSFCCAWPRQLLEGSQSSGVPTGSPLHCTNRGDLFGPEL